MLHSYRKLLVISALSLVVVACSSNKEYQRQSDSDFKYLSAPQLAPLKGTEGVTLPYQQDIYAINNQKMSGNIGERLDIRSPDVVIPLLDGSVVSYNKGQATLEAPLSEQTANLWNTVLAVLKMKNIAINNVNNTIHSFETGDVVWNRKDEVTPYTARYAIDVISRANKVTLHTRLLSLKHRGQDVQDSIAQQRYGVALMNVISQDIVEHQYMSAEQRNASLKDKVIQFQLSSDSTGLPILVTRSSFDAVWQQLPLVLPRIGMLVNNKEQDSGLVNVKFVGLSSNQLKSLGLAQDTHIQETDYQLQLGDLSSRTSLQINDKDGRPLNDKDNKQLFKLLETGFLGQGLH